MGCHAKNCACIVSFLLLTLIGQWITPAFALELKLGTQHISLPENMTIGSIVTSAAVDADNVMFGIEPLSYVGLKEGESGRNRTLVLIQKWSRKTDSEFYFKVTASLNNQKPVALLCTVYVQDVNDHPPIFNEAKSTKPLVFFPENNMTDAPLITLYAYDVEDAAKLGTNGIIFDMKFQNKQEEYSSYFNMTARLDSEEAVCEIFLKKQFDFEKTSMFRFTVEAKDNGGEEPNQSATYSMTINVEDMDDTGPEFIKVPSVTKIKENLIKDSFVLQVEAIDGDRNINSPIKYSIIDGNTNDTCKIQTPKEGIVTIQNPPDREQLKEEMGFTLVILATEYANDLPGKSTNVSCTVIVEDVNDCPPKFTYSTYDATVEENSPRGIGVTITGITYDFIEVTDEDERKHAGFAVNLVDDPNQPFAIMPTRGVLRESFVVQVANKQLLDFETLQQNPVIITLVATDNSEDDPQPKFSDRATIRINVTDANDNFPVFNQTLYNVSILEHSEVGTSVAHITAVDIDTGNFGTAGIRYSLLGTSEQFQINEETGEISVQNSKLLDRERNSEALYLTVEARDNLGTGNGNTSQVVVMLLDINDNPPRFVYSSYKATLEENEEDFQIALVIKAEDADIGKNQEIVYHIEKNIAQGAYFQFNTSTPKADEQLLVPKTPLDYEKICSDQQKFCRLDVIVVATDRGDIPLSTNITVVITFLDTNDEHPKFAVREIGNITINETVPGGTYVANVTATDLDVTDEFRKISYQITDGSNSLFTIKQDNGIITTGPKAKLQLSRTDTIQYNLTVAATDGAVNSGDPDSICYVIITIRDINNEAPEFLSPKYKAFVYENATVNSILDCKPDVNATDMDSNAHLMYSIVYDDAEASGPGGDDVKKEEYINLFGINPSGQVFVKTKLDRETVQRLVMTLQVIDDAAEIEPPEQTATATLTVTIGDVNDNAPDFEQDAYYGTVMENAPNGTKIEPIVKATDKDENQKITYTLEGNAAYLELVNITETGGRVGVLSNINREVIPNFVVTVVATDNGIPPLSSNVTFNITVTDVNDNAPVFNPSSYAVFISEDAEIGTSVVNVSATDIDEGDYGTVMYIFPNGEYNFDIDSQTGQITVKDVLNCDTGLDHLEDLIVTVAVQARDNQNIFPYQVGVTTVNITITDVNDNAPVVQYISDISVSEDRNVNATLATIKATDPDKGDNGTVVLYLEEDKMDHTVKGLFQINMKNSDSGDLVVRNSLVGKVGEWEVFIMAHDNGTPHQISISARLVVVKILDVNDHSPDFHSPQESKTFQVAIDQGDYLIAKINATDDDYDDNGRISFSLSNYSDKFEIKQKKNENGIAELHLKDDLKDQGIIQYKVTIIACDSGTPNRCTPCNIFVTVKDHSEHPPKFKKPANETVTFTEEQDGNAETNPLPHATDDDLVFEVQEQICYYVVGGDVEKKFALNKDSNVLTTTEVLDRESTDSYTLYVFATNQCNNLPGSLTVNDDLSNLNDSYLQVNVVVKDINDNPPTFGSKPPFTGGVDNKVQRGEKIILKVVATDPDDGDNAAIFYYKNSNVRKYKDHNMDSIDDIDTCFIVESTTGGITTGCLFGENMKGYFEFSVLANNSKQVVSRNGFINQNATAFVKIYVLRVDQKLKFTLFSTPEAFHTVKDRFLSKLSQILGVTVTLDDVQICKDCSGKEDSSKSEVYVHFVNQETNEVLDPTEMQRMLDILDDRNIEELWSEFRVLKIENGDQPPSNTGTDQEKLKEILIMAAAGALGTVLVVLLTAYCIRVNKLERKLKAATTSAFDNKTVTDSHTPNMPTTNVHAKDGSNPLWNYEFDGNDPRLLESNDSDSIVSGEILPEAFDGGKNNGGFPAMMETFFLTDMNDEPHETADDIEMKTQLNSNFIMKRPDDTAPTSDNFILKQSDDLALSSDNFIMKQRDDENNPPTEI